MSTPIQLLKTGNAGDNQIYIKRDDLLPFSMGGNKVRIAEAFFRDMLEKGRDSMIIYGSRHSNLCRVLADLCCSRGVVCVMICSHETQEEETPTFNTHLIQWAGVDILHCEKSEIASTVEYAMQMLTDQGRKPYYIYGDKFGKGNEGTAAEAYANAYREVQSYETEQGWEFDYLFCPSGTGATQSGLICGHLLAGDRKKIMGVLISSRETQRARQVIDEGISCYFSKHGLTLPRNYQNEIHLLDQYRLGGYGRYDDSIRELIQNVYRTNGIPLDPIYTAKAYQGMLRYLDERNIRDCRVLFLHTGGTPLFYDYLQSC